MASVLTIDGASGTGKSSLAASLRAAGGCDVVEIGPLVRSVAWMFATGLAPSVDAGAWRLWSEFARQELIIDTTSTVEPAATALWYGARRLDEELWDPRLATVVKEAARSRAVDRCIACIVRICVDRSSKVVVVGREAGLNIAPYAAVKVELGADVGVRRERKSRQLPGSDKDIALLWDVGARRVTPPDHVLYDTTSASEPEILELVSRAWVAAGTRSTATTGLRQNSSWLRW